MPTHSVVSCDPAPASAGEDRSVLTIHVLSDWRASLNSDILDVVREVVG
jgi:hypothetical protein